MRSRWRLTAGTLFYGCREEADIWIAERPPGGRRLRRIAA
jgi:hypothetical protein